MSSVPIVDLRELTGGTGETAALRALDQACREHGFFLLRGHGLEAAIESLWPECRAFFRTPKAFKRSVERSRDNALGYFDRELTKQRRDRKEVFDFADDRQDTEGTGFGRSQWPQGMPAFREHLLEYSRSAGALTVRILGAIYQALGLSAAAVPASIGTRHSSFVRLNHYPVEDPLAQHERAGVTPLGDMALHHHTDPGVVTLLLQDQVGGLQCCTRDGAWIDVPPHPDAIVVNLSDMLQVLSNDRYRSAVHRVRPVPGEDRYSIVYFSMPSHDALIEPERALGTHPRYRAFPWAEFISGRLGDNFADYGVDDIQITNFRLSSSP